MSKDWREEQNQPLSFESLPVDTLLNAILNDLVLHKQTRRKTLESLNKVNASQIQLAEKRGYARAANAYLLTGEKERIAQAKIEVLEELKNGCYIDGGNGNKFVYVKEIDSRIQELKG